MVQGEMAKKAEETVEKKDSIQFEVTEELVEAISSDIISEVEMDREMHLSKRIVDEILSIYMKSFTGGISPKMNSSDQMVVH